MSKKIFNRKRPQVTFNMNSTLEVNLYNKVYELNPESFSDAVKHILFAYFYPPGYTITAREPLPEPSVEMEEEIIEDVSGLPNL